MTSAKDKKQRIIFLDIDGPVIPGHLYIKDRFCSYYRTTFSKDSINCINWLCKESGAKVVTNSMQNYLIPRGSNLQQDLIRWGLKAKHFHTDWRTIFPYVDYAANPNPRKGWGRWLGIQDWQEQNGEANWVCFDDRIFTDDPRLIPVAFKTGVTKRQVEGALRLFAMD